MEEDTVLTKSEFCFACLSFGDEKQLKYLDISNEFLKALLKVEKPTLCVACTKIALDIENFVYNVQTSQRLLEGLAVITKTTLIATQRQLQQLVDTHNNVEPVKANVEYGPSTEYMGTEENDILENIEVKTEMKSEYDDQQMFAEMFVDGLSDGDINNDEFKEEFDVIEKKKKYEDKPKRKKKKLKREDDNKCVFFKKKVIKLGIVEKHYISEKDFLEERTRKASEPAYLAAAYRCGDCVKGFQFHETYERHMERHKESAGDYVCSVCKQRMVSQKKLREHQTYHQIRFKCSKCDVTNIVMVKVKQHYREVHEGHAELLTCPHCPKTFKSPTNLKRHMWRHSAACAQQRRVCRVCHKTYANRAVLEVHVHDMHGAGAEAGRRAGHACPDCGKVLRAPSCLKKHMLTHTDRKDYYCVECDRSFKSETSLQAHLNRTVTHKNERVFKYECQHCDKKFACRRDVDRHTNRIHLNARPYSCDKCDRTYIEKWSLTEHRMRVHEGKKRKLAYPCTYCDKVFTHKHILTAHVRTHTGERPFACATCGKAFAQRSVLQTHVRLVHLRLRRDGRVKT